MQQYQRFACWVLFMAQTEVDESVIVFGQEVTGVKEALCFVYNQFCRMSTKTFAQTHVVTARPSIS